MFIWLWQGLEGVCGEVTVCCCWFKGKGERVCEHRQEAAIEMERGSVADRAQWRAGGGRVWGLSTCQCGTAFCLEKSTI